MCRFLSYIHMICFVFVLTGCGHTPPSFVQVIEPGWASIEIRDGMNSDDAWKEVVDVLAKKV